MSFLAKQCRGEQKRQVSQDQVQVRTLRNFSRHWCISKENPSFFESVFKSQAILSKGTCPAVQLHHFCISLGPWCTYGTWMGMASTLPKCFHTYFPFLSLPSLSVSSDHDLFPDQPQEGHWDQMGFAWEWWSAHTENVEGFRAELVNTVLGVRIRGQSCHCVPKTAPCNRFSIGSRSLFTPSLSPGCRANSCTSVEKVLLSASPFTEAQGAFIFILVNQALVLLLPED